jgi:hypothetical protein
MGVGDRHLDNIMISEEDATLFHIDYAYILGHDPKPIHPFARLTPEMIDAMGGTSSIYYTQFCNYCEKAIHCIRRHQNVFHILLLYGCMIDNRITPEQINYFILSRFMPNQTSHEVYKIFMRMLEDTNETYGVHLMDFIHKQYKRSNSRTDVNDLSVPPHLPSLVSSFVSSHAPPKLGSSTVGVTGNKGNPATAALNVSKIGLSSSYEMVQVAQPVIPSQSYIQGYNRDSRSQPFPPYDAKSGIHTKMDSYTNQLTVQLSDTVNVVSNAVAHLPSSLSRWTSAFVKKIQ